MFRPPLPRREFRHPKRRPPLLRTLGVMLGWSIGGLLALLLGVLVGFRIWSPHVIQEFNRVLAGTSNNTLVYDRYDQLISTIAGLEDRHTVPIAQLAAAAAIADNLPTDKAEKVGRAARPPKLGKSPSGKTLKIKRQPGEWMTFKCTCGATKTLSPGFTATKMKCKKCARTIEIE